MPAAPVTRRCYTTPVVGGRIACVAGLAMGLVAAGSLSPAAGAVTVWPSPLQRYREAQAALAGAEYRRAQLAFEELTGSFVLADYAAYFAAESLLRGGDEGAALERFRAFPDRHPDSVLVPVALLAATDTAFRLGRFPEAEREARRMLARAPAHPEAGRVLVRLAEARAEQGHVAEAIADLRRRWIEAPASTWGEAAREVMDDLARRHGLPVAPLGAEELLTQAQRLLDATELTAGVRVLESIFPLQPEPAVRERALLRLAPALGRLSRGTEGIERLTAALTDLPTAARSSLLLEIGRLQVRGGQTAAGTATFERLVAEHGDTPTAPEAWLALARARADLGQTDGARQAYRTLLTVHEQAAVAGPARWELAWLDYRDGRLRDAALGFRQLSAVGTSNRLAGLYWAGRSLEALGERGAATALFREVHSRGPHTYYGPLAERRLPRGKPPPPVAPALRLPADPLAFLEREVRFQKARALTQVGLDGYAVLELETLGRDAGLDSERAWSLGAAFAQLGEAGRSLRYLRRSFGPAADGGAPGLPPLFWRLYYPLGFADLVQDAARRAGLDPHLVAAVIREESSYDPRARSWVGAVGLMQLMPDTGRLLSTQVGVPLVDPLGLWDPLVNITLGAHYLAQLRSRFGEPLLAVAGYNAGPHRVQRWIERRPPVDLEEFIDQIPFEETRAFVKRVSASWHHYRRLYGSTASEPRRGAMASPRPPR